MMQKRLCVIRGAGRRECQYRLCWSINVDGGDRLQIDMEDIKKLNQRLVETEPPKGTVQTLAQIPAGGY